MVEIIFFFKKETHSGLSLIDKRNVDDKWLSVDKLVAMVQIWTSPKVPSLAEKSLAVSNAAHSSFCGVKVKPVSEQLAGTLMLGFFSPPPPPNLSNSLKNE